MVSRTVARSRTKTCLPVIVVVTGMSAISELSTYSPLTYREAGISTEETVTDPDRETVLKFAPSLCGLKMLQSLEKLGVQLLTEYGGQRPQEMN